MRSIVKRAEPPLLADARRDAHRGGQRITREDYPPAGQGAVNTLRIALCAEQHGLCAYCNGRITSHDANRAHPERGGMSVEHWIPRSGYPDSDDAQRASCGEHALEWSNLLGVCVGVSVGPDRDNALHCDQSRGNRRLYLHPAQTPGLAPRFKIEPVTGRWVASAPQDREVRCDLDTLNLNAERLKANRAMAINRFRERLKKDGTLKNIKRLYQLASEPGPDGLLPPFASAVERYLAPKLRAHGLHVAP